MSAPVDQAIIREAATWLATGGAQYARADWSESDEAVIRAAISVDQSYVQEAIHRYAPVDPFASAEVGRQAFDNFISDLRGFLKRNTQ